MDSPQGHLAILRWNDLDIGKTSRNYKQQVIKTKKPHSQSRVGLFKRKLQVLDLT